MAMTLWGRETSSNVQKVVWTLKELGLDYEHIPLGGKYGGLDQPDFAAMNPNRLVPVFQDGPFRMWESNAIVRYLAGTYGVGTLWPTDTRERARCDQWADWSATTLLRPWVQTFWLTLRLQPGQESGPRDAALAEAISAFRILDAHIESVPYIAGEAFTYADIIVGVMLYRWFTLDIERPELPALAAWYGRLQDRKPYRDGVCISYEEMRPR